MFQNVSDLQFSRIHTNMWVKVFKNGPSKICRRQSLKSFTWFILEYLDPSDLTSFCSYFIASFTNAKSHSPSVLIEFPWLIIQRTSSSPFIVSNNWKQKCWQAFANLWYVFSKESSWFAYRKHNLQSLNVVKNGSSYVRATYTGFVIAFNVSMRLLDCPSLSFVHKLHWHSKPCGSSIM